MGGEKEHETSIDARGGKRERRERERGGLQQLLCLSSEYIRIQQKHATHTSTTPPTQTTRPHTTTIMDLLPPSTPPRAAASFPLSAAGTDTKTQEAAVPPSSTTLSSLLDQKEGPPAPVDALTCFATLPFLFSPFLGPKDCLTMAGLQKVGEEEQVGGGWIGCQRWSAVCRVRVNATR